jgi:hypothetical protein
LGIQNLSIQPLKIAVDIIYERVQDADVEYGECDLRQSRVVVEMTEAAYNQVPAKENFVEIGTGPSGEKQYLWRGKLLLDS